jgi:hypothetical protein
MILIIKPTIENESLHEINNDNEDRVLSFDTYENLTVKSTMFPHRNFLIHLGIWWKGSETNFFEIQFICNL